MIGTVIVRVCSDHVLLHEEMSKEKEIRKHKHINVRLCALCVRVRERRVYLSAFVETLCCMRERRRGEEERIQILFIERKQALKRRCEYDVEFATTC